MLALYIRQLRRDIFPRLVVHDNHRAGHDVIALPLLLRDILFHQETDSLRAVGKAVIGNVLVQRLQQMIFQGYTKSF